MQKEKMQNALRKCAVGIVGIALIGWIGYSAYGTYESRKPQQEAHIDYTALTDLQSELAEVGGTAD